MPRTEPADGHAHLSGGTGTVTMASRTLDCPVEQDQLTGLTNRYYLSEHLTKIAPRGQVAVSFIDLDHFKNVNDIHGHRVGDFILQQAAQRLRTLMADSDIVARWGGDEFVVVHVDPQRAGRACEYAAGIRTVLADPYPIEGNYIHLTASVGIAITTKTLPDREDVLHRADLALFAAKAKGGDRIELFDNALALEVAAKGMQRDRVQSALDNDRVDTHYQPIVDLDNNLVGLEALARYVGPDGDLVEADTFIQAIVGTHLIERLDSRAFELACAAATTFANRDIWVACNFSSATLARSDLANRVLNTIDAFGLQPQQICIEITETTSFEAGQRTIAQLQRLFDAGVKISLDDFGTGYSSLSHLRDLPLSTVKIDKSFTTALTTNSPERAIAGAVANLAHVLGLTVIVEGVECQDQVEAARILGFDTVQGWHISRALSIGDLCKQPAFAAHLQHASAS